MSTEDLLIEAPSLLPLFGREWRVQKHTRADRAELEAYAREQTPQPIKALKRDLEELRPLLTDEQMGETVRARLPEAQEAERRWPPAFGSPEFQSIFARPEHAPVLLWVALRRHQGATSLDEVRQLLDRAEQEGDQGPHELQVLNVVRRFLLGAERPVTREELERTRKEREEAEANLLGKLLAAAGAGGAEDLAAAIRALGGSGSPPSSGPRPPGPSPSVTGGPPTSSPA